MSDPVSEYAFDKAVRASTIPSPSYMWFPFY